MIRQEIKVGDKFQIGTVNNKIRVLEVTSIIPLGVMFSVTPGTWESNSTEMYADYRDKDFWDRLKPYKEKIVYKPDLVWLRYQNDYRDKDFWDRLKPYKEKIVYKRDLVWLRYQNDGPFALLIHEGQRTSSIYTELSRTTVEYTEEK